MGTDRYGAIRAGAINVTIAQRPYTIGYRVMSYLYEIAKRGVDPVLKGIPPSGIVDTGIRTITKDNLDGYVESLRRQGLPVDF